MFNKRKVHLHFFFSADKNPRTRPHNTTQRCVFSNAEWQAVACHAGSCCDARARTRAVRCCGCGVLGGAGCGRVGCGCMCEGRGLCGGVWVGERGQYLWDGGESICLINEPLVPLESVCSMITSQHSAGKFAVEPITTRLATMQHTSVCTTVPARRRQNRTNLHFREPSQGWGG